MFLQFIFCFKDSRNCDKFSIAVYIHYIHIFCIYLIFIIFPWSIYGNTVSFAMCNNVANCNIKAAEMRWHNFYLQLRTSHPTIFSAVFIIPTNDLHLMAFTIFMTLAMRRVVYLVMMYWISKRGRIKWRRTGKKFMHRKWQKFWSFMSTRARLCLCGFTGLSSTSLLSHEQKSYLNFVIITRWKLATHSRQRRQRECWQQTRVNIIFPFSSSYLLFPFPICHRLILHLPLVWRALRARFKSN